MYGKKKKSMYIHMHLYAYTGKKNEKKSKTFRNENIRN